MVSKAGSSDELGTTASLGGSFPGRLACMLICAQHGSTEPDSLSLGRLRVGSGGNMKFYFTVPVWGNNHIDLFTNVGLPSLLSPGNIPGLRDVGQCRFFIHTFPEDEARLAGSRSVERLSRLMPVEIRLIRSPVISPYRTMSDCHKEIMRLADANNLPTVFPSPDHVWSDGSMARMEQIAELVRR